jgi:hypothetical protein
MIKNDLMIKKQNAAFENWITDLEARAEIEDFRKYHF